MSPISVYQHILAHLPSEGPGLLPGGERLPDEPERDDLHFGFAPGLLDEILERGSEIDNQRAASSIVRRIRDALEDPESADAWNRLNHDLSAQKLVGFLDPLLDRVYHAGFPRRKLRELALRLATRSTERMPVKVGIALLGLCARRRDRDVLLTLARHEEFSHYVGITLANAFDDSEEIRWELAKVVDGWGRINLVRQLASTRRPEIKAWILREGSQSWFVLHHLAYIAATTGDLVGALRADEIDDALCLATARILHTLIEQRPYESSEDIDDYEDGPEAIRRFLAHAGTNDPSLELFEPIAWIVDYLELRDGRLDPFRDRWRHGQPAPARWTEDDRVRVATSARWILVRPEWRRVVDEGLRSDDGWTFQMAEWAARWLGDDTFPLLLDRFRRLPKDETGWFEAATIARDLRRWNQLMDAAIERLLRHETDPGPMFPGWMIALTQEIERFPNTGWPLFRAGLQSPLMIERRFGLRGLRWFMEPGWIWPDEADAMLERIAARDPDAETRGWAADLLEEHQAPWRITTP